MIWFEDIEIGKETEYGSYEVTREEVLEFARKYDPQPFHLSDEAAAKTHFGRIAASGWHTAGITMSLLVKSGMPISGGLIGAGGEIEWPRPVRPGDVLQVESEVLAVVPSRSRPERGMITVKSVTKNQRGEVVQTLTSKMLVWKKGS